MNQLLKALAILVSLAAAHGQSLRGVVTDPSHAAVPRAIVQLRGPGGERVAATDDFGAYVFSPLGAGRYQIRVTARGFAAVQKNLSIDRATVFDTQLVIRGEKQVVTVEDDARRVGVNPESNGGSLVMRERQIAALSDDPDELALQLQALAGPAPGPNGGQVYIDGFNGSSLPPKSSIREIRINSNPFAPEYDKPGFARVDIFTKPGTDSIHGQAFAQVNDDALNTRNPLLTQNAHPPYGAQLYGLNISGPLSKNRASFTLDAEHRRIQENAFVFTTMVNEAIAAPQTRTSVTPRFDYAVTSKNTLVMRYQELRIGLDNQGVGDFNLASRAYKENQSERLLQIIETAMLNSHTMNETRVQYLRSSVQDIAANSAVGINVQGAFFGGGATTGNSGSVSNNWELSNLSTYSRGRNAFKWGGRIRESRIDDTSMMNFAGTFTFYTLEDYEHGRPSQFTLNGGTALSRVGQFDAGVFFNDDFRIRPNLTLSAGVRYEAQTNWGDGTNFGPRVGIAWGIAPKTVVRAGAGVFYDRLPLSATLNDIRYNGVTQQSFFIQNPSFYPVLPVFSVLNATHQPQQLRPVYRGIDAPRLVQTSIGIERQLNRSSRVTATWIRSRGVHLLNNRNVNTPTDGTYPFGDQSVRLLLESAGSSIQNQVIVNTNVNVKNVFLFGYYGLSYGMDNNEGLPADSYNLRAEWGPSAYADLRHRAAAGGTIPLWWKFSLSPFAVANSGQPYNITTGLDPLLTGFPTARPSSIAPGCLIANCFSANPQPGASIIEHNYGRGPAAFNLGLRFSRTWAFGGEGQTGPMNQGGSQHGAGPMMMAGPNPGRRYSITLSASTLNALNHPNFAPPNGDLSSPYFGQYRSLGGLIVIAHGGAPNTYNRKIDLQIRFTF